MWPHTVAILIGGQSERMGRPKHLVTLPNGKTMLETMLVIASSIAEQTVILGGEIHSQHCIHDLRKNHGPVAGIEALLHSGIDSNYLVIGCDMPSMTSESVAPLLRCETNAIFSYNHRLLGLPLRVGSEALSACSKYLDAGGRSVWGFLSSIEHTSIPLNEIESAVFLSVNTPDDLNKLAVE
jgi:molybdopterin-guanine dinucleotide biosynthesis protein A